MWGRGPFAWSARGVKLCSRVLDSAQALLRNTYIIVKSSTRQVSHQAGFLIVLTPNGEQMIETCSQV